MSSNVLTSVDAMNLVRLMAARCTVFPSSWGNPWAMATIFVRLDPVLPLQEVGRGSSLICRGTPRGRRGRRPTLRTPNIVCLG
jgi:hypothetical protein